MEAPTKRDLQKELEEEIVKYKMLVEDRFKKVNIYDNYINLSKQTILDLFNLLGLEKHNGVKKGVKIVTKVLTVDEIMLQFADKEIANLVACHVDLEATRDNIMLKHGFSRSVADAILRNIKELYEYKYEELEVIK